MEERLALTARAGDGDGVAKVLYHPCRTGVFAPVGWRSSDTGRSALPPAAALQLEWVHGYAGVSNLGNNLWCASSGEAVYCTAAVGVVCDVAAHAQRFFLGHDDDISCLTLDGSRTHAASGQVGAEPVVLVWSVSSLAQLARLRHGRVLGITAVGFSADGGLLASAGRDDLNTVHVWDWRQERLLSTVEGQKSVPPAVWGVQWAAEGGAVAGEQQLQVAGAGASPACLVSYGARHIKLWGSKDGRGKTESWSMKVLRFGASGAADVLGVAVLSSGVLVSGAPDGKLLVWRGGEVVARLGAHGHECRVVRLAHGGRQLLSGGGDGRVLVWGVAGLEGVGQPAAEVVAETDRKIAALRLRLAGLEGREHKPERAQVSMELYSLEKGRHGGSLELEPERVLAVGGGGRAAAVRGLDGEASGGGVLVGTSGCDVVRLSGEGAVAMVVDGHTADLHGVARSPVDGRLFATACDSAKVKVWDAQARCALLELRVGGPARAVCFSSDGGRLAVGLLDGSVEVLALPQVSEAAAAGGGASKLETRLHESRRPVSALAWSPEGSTLAVGNVEGAIDLYDVARWTRLARCRGHSTKVTQLDWSRDAALLQSNCNAYEILYWEGRSGRQVCSPQREYTQWDGWSCTLGWPVMGIWQEGFDPSDVNAAHASDDGSLLVVSDDRGGVCLYRFPCVAPRAAYSRAAGHASHVCSVRWLLGSGRCVSVGGHDRAVMQWRLVESPELSTSRAH